MDTTENILTRISDLDVETGIADAKDDGVKGALEREKQRRVDAGKWNPVPAIQLVSDAVVQAGIDRPKNAAAKAEFDAEKQRRLDGGTWIGVV